MTTSYAAQRAARSRATILAAAERCFLREGYSISMDEIVRESGVSKSTLFSHFPTKDLLFREVMKEIAVQELQLDPLCGASNFEDRLALFGRTFADAVLADRSIKVHRLVLHEAPRFPQLARSHYEAGIGRVVPALEAFLKLGQERGVVRLGNPKMLAELFVGMMMGVRQHRAMLAMGDENFSAGDYVDYAVGMMLAKPGAPLT